MRSNPLLLILLPILCGAMVPDIVISRMIHNRKGNLQRALPDALDLAVVSVEAGLGLDQSLVKIGQELRTVYPALSEELNLYSLEVNAGKKRADALRNLGNRTDVDDIKSFTDRADPDRPLRHQCGEIVAGFCRYHARQTKAAGGGTCRQNEHQDDSPAGIFYFPGNLCRGARSSDYYSYSHFESRHGGSHHQLHRRYKDMDVTTIRIAASVLFFIVLGILIYRIRSKKSKS